MGFKFSQHRRHWVCSNQPWDSNFPNIGGIGFGVTSHGIQVFPTTGGGGHWVCGNQPWDSSFSQHRGTWVCGNQPWDSSFPNIRGHWVCGNQPWDSSFPNIGGHWVCGNQPWDSSFPNIGDIGFVVTSHGIQIFPISGALGLG